MEIKIPFALREGNLVHISDISKNEKGLGCNCRCIECGEILIARIGEKILGIFHIITRIQIVQEE